MRENGVWRVSQVNLRARVGDEGDKQLRDNERRVENK